MKKVLFKTMSVILVGVALTACTKKSSPTPSSSTNTNTNTSTATFSATVNGTPITMTGSASYNSSAGWLTISASGGGYVIQAVDLAPAVGSVTLSSYTTFNSYATITQTATSEVWSTDATHTGTFTLTTYNTTSKIISGSISFTANETSPTAGGSTINITNGTFANISF